MFKLHYLNLHLSPKLYEIYLTKDKYFGKFDLRPKFLNKVLFFEFLNMNPK
jgi:hypothetical protein